MDKKKLIKEDLKNFNSIVLEVKMLNKELLLYSGQEEKFQDEIISIERKINKCTRLLKSIKISLEALSSMEIKIITLYYFEKKTVDQIAYIFGCSKEYIYQLKAEGVKRLADIVYYDYRMKDLDSFRVIPEKKKKTKIVYQYDLNGVFIKKWNSLKEAAEKLKVNSNNISCCCSGKMKTCKGYKWSYVPM